MWLESHSCKPSWKDTSFIWKHPSHTKLTEFLLVAFLLLFILCETNSVSTSKVTNLYLCFANFDHCTNDSVTRSIVFGENILLSWVSCSSSAKVLAHYLSALHYKCFRPLLIYIYRVQMPGILTVTSICFVSMWERLCLTERSLDL